MSAVGKEESREQGRSVKKVISMDLIITWGKYESRLTLQNPCHTCITQKLF